MIKGLQLFAGPFFNAYENFNPNNLYVRLTFGFEFSIFVTDSISLMNLNRPEIS
jgi:hypothetical protein